jgi:hypothetical protein
MAKVEGWFMIAAVAANSLSMQTQEFLYEDAPRAWTDIEGPEQHHLFRVDYLMDHIIWEHTVEPLKSELFTLLSELKDKYQFFYLKLID